MTGFRNPGPPRVLFATSNGTGLGHLNRSMAMARRLPADWESSFFTLSGAAPVVADQGYGVDYLASYRRPASGTDRAWDLRLKSVFARILAERRPDLVVFDGVHPYRGLTHLLSARGAPRSIWCRRAMWRHDTPAAALKRAGAFDAVLEPGELAQSADRGPTVPRRGEAKRIRPIVFLDPGEQLDRAEAAAALGLDPSRRTALVNLGQGGELDRAVSRTIGALTAVPGLQVAVLQSSIAPDVDLPRGVSRLSATFPMSRYFRAFDMAVAAAGYNAFHELVAFGVPTLFVPMPRNTDDQGARARWAAGAGVALAVGGAGDPALEDELSRLVDPAVAAGLREASLAAFPGNGAFDGASVIERAVAGERIGPEVRNRRRFNRWLRLSSHPVGPSLPLVAAVGARDLMRHPERRAPRLAILALGVPAEELPGRIVEAAAGVPRERVLVLTDSLDFAALRRIGVGFELLPQWPPEGGGRPSLPIDQMRARIRALLERRQPLRAVSVGAGGEELFGLDAASQGSQSR